METLGRDDHHTNSITKRFERSVKNHSPSESLLGPFIRSRFFLVSHQHNILIRELKIHGLVVIHGMMSQMISQHTPLDFFMGCILYIVLS